jgi:TolB-like protein
MSDWIGHYNILSTIGTGILGPVYRARDTKHGRTVAIRVLTQGMEDPAQRARALDLVQPYLALTHPHVATLFEAGEQPGSVYLVYEFVPGEKLNAAVAGQPMNLRRALDLASHLADGLAEAHALGVVHGALTASSVMVTPKGHAKILDFGLYACVPDSTRNNLEKLTPADRQAARIESLGRSRVAYAAPEQLLGQAPDQRSDLFALGALVYEMVTGKHAFSGRTPLDIGVAVLQSRPPTPSTSIADAPRRLDQIIARALAKKPAERYASAALMAAHLRDAAAVVQSQSARERPVTVKRRPRWRMAMLGALLIVAAALGLWRWQEPMRQAWRGWFGRQPEPVVVILPFYATPTEAPRAYYGAGFAEDLARRIAHVPGITVLGRLSVRAAIGKPPQAAAAAVGARLALTGSLKPMDDEWTTLDVETRLIDCRDGRVLWSSSHKSAAQDLLALQAVITGEITEWLRIQYQPTAEQNRATLRLVNPSAYDKYLQAREALASFDAGRAVQLFDAAALEDPSLIEAQSGLAEALYTMSVFEGREQFGNVRVRARQAAEAAFATDPDLAMTRLAMGLTAPTSREALEHLKRAVQLDGTYTSAYLALADILRPIDPGRAAGFARRAAQFDPAQPLVYYEIAVVSLSSGDFDGALLAMGRGQALAPSLPWWDAIRDRVSLARKPTPEPAGGQNTRDAGDFPPGIVLRAAVLGVSGRTSDAATLAGTLLRRHPGSCEARAILAAVLVKGNRPADGIRAAAGIAAKAADASEGEGWAGCAAMAAAAVNDPARAAAALNRIASSDVELRAWSTVNPLADGQVALRQSVFPWSNIAADPAVAAALARIDAALAKERVGAGRVLQGM